MRFLTTRPFHSTSLTLSAKNIVQTFLHGNAPNPSPSQPLETTQMTFSKILARGKYVHELSVHNVKPEAMEDYLDLLKHQFPRIADDPAFKVRLLGSWTTEIGELDQAIHIWEYQHYPGYTDTSSKLSQDVEYQAFLRKLRPMLRSRSNQIMLEFAFWETAQDVKADPNGIYELRTYLLKPGQLLDWELQWRRGIEARKKYVEPVGAWFSQLGDLNYVHHMWKYPNLQARKEMREQAWKDDGWASTVTHTVKLIDHMQSKILKPTVFSPFK